ncbi:hypothetical protein M0R45_031743 [Rubus argutus]|uniref:Uncharacterized protein n=1 Tax=Rubus argutus TaxID=59490 RepID=A0AAW1WF15_RUBAR
MGDGGRNKEKAAVSCFARRRRRRRRRETARLMTRWLGRVEVLGNGFEGWRFGRCDEVMEWRTPKEKGNRKDGGKKRHGLAWNCDL